MTAERAELVKAPRKPCTRAPPSWSSGANETPARLWQLRCQAYQLQAAAVNLALQIHHIFELGSVRWWHVDGGSSAGL